jgi:hypothetical protein
MNDWDKDNLNFIMSADKDTYMEWVLSLDEDGLDYAINLVHTYRATLIEQELDWMEADLEDLTESYFILSKFTLKG